MSALRRFRILQLLKNPGGSTVSKLPPISKTCSRDLNLQSKLWHLNNSYSQRSFAAVTGRLFQSDSTVAESINIEETGIIWEDMIKDLLSADHKAGKFLPPERTAGPFITSVKNYLAMCEEGDPPQEEFNKVIEIAKGQGKGNLGVAAMLFYIHLSKMNIEEMESLLSELKNGPPAHKNTLLDMQLQFEIAKYFKGSPVEDLQKNWRTIIEQTTKLEAVGIRIAVQALGDMMAKIPLEYLSTEKIFGLLKALIEATQTPDSTGNLMFFALPHLMLPTIRIKKTRPMIMEYYECAAEQVEISLAAPYVFEYYMKNDDIDMVKKVLGIHVENSGTFAASFSLFAGLICAGKTSSAMKTAKTFDLVKDQGLVQQRLLVMLLSDFCIMRRRELEVMLQTLYTCHGNALLKILQDMMPRLSKSVALKISIRGMTEELREKSILVEQLRRYLSQSNTTLEEFLK